MITAIILGGSHVWREDCLESVCPRLLLPVLNAPLVSYTLAWLRGAGVNQVVICANDATHFVRARFQEGADQGVELYYYEDHTPRGPAGCSRDAAALVGADHYVIVEGSVLPALDLRGLLRFHERTGAAATVVAQPAEHDGDGLDGNLCPAGIYVVARRTLEQVPPLGYQDLKEVLIPRLYRQREWVVVYPAEAQSPRLKDLGSYLAVQGWMLARLAGRDMTDEGYAWRGAAGSAKSDCALLHRTARVAEGAKLVGQVMLGPGSRVDDEAIIVGPTVMGRDGVVGRRALVKRSVLWDASAVEERASLDQCLMVSGSSAVAGVSHHGAICPPQGPARVWWRRLQGQAGRA